MASKLPPDELAELQNEWRSTLEAKGLFFGNDVSRPEEEFAFTPHAAQSPIQSIAPIPPSVSVPNAEVQVYDTVSRREALLQFRGTVLNPDPGDIGQQSGAEAVSSLPTNAIANGVSNLLARIRADHDALVLCLRLYKDKIRPLVDGELSTVGVLDKLNHQLVDEFHEVANELQSTCPDPQWTYSPYGGEEGRVHVSDSALLEPTLDSLLHAGAIHSVSINVQQQTTSLSTLLDSRLAVLEKRVLNLEHRVTADADEAAVNSSIGGVIDATRTALDVLRTESSSETTRLVDHAQCVVLEAELLQTATAPQVHIDNFKNFPELAKYLEVKSPKDILDLLTHEFYSAKTVYSDVLPSVVQFVKANKSLMDDATALMEGVHSVEREHRSLKSQLAYDRTFMKSSLEEFLAAAEKQASHASPSPVVGELLPTG